MWNISWRRGWVEPGGVFWLDFEGKSIVGVALQCAILNTNTVKLHFKILLRRGTKTRISFISG